jgi:hypothetical protein
LAVNKEVDVEISYCRLRPLATLQAYIILTLADINTVSSLDKKEVVGVLLTAAATNEYSSSLA